MRKRITIVVLLSVFILITTEITLRKAWGFGEMILFQEDENFEYIPKPNQLRTRFGSKTIYNEFSMRSNSVDIQDSAIVLGFGDSVFNGGAMMDQDSLATTLVENQLAGVRFLNISAASWGPDNCAEYLRKYGDFNAKMIILFVSSHDAHDIMTHKKTVGENPSYPAEQYPLAIIELIERYVAPRIYMSALAGRDTSMLNRQGKIFNPGFNYFNDHTVQCGIPFLICLHAEMGEIEANCFMPGGEEIISYCQMNNIKIISGLEIGEKAVHLYDYIHLNERGQRLWAEVLFEEIAATLNRPH